MAPIVVLAGHSSFFLFPALLLWFFRAGRSPWRKLVEADAAETLISYEIDVKAGRKKKKKGAPCGRFARWMSGISE